jgi:hypothetical protein
VQQLITEKMAELNPISIRFTNELKDHIEAQRVLYSKNALAKLDKAIAVLLFVFGVYCVVAVGLRWWTVIWFPLAVAEWFNWLSLNRWRIRIEFRRNLKFREEYHLTFSRENIHFQTASIDSTLQWTHYDRVIESPDLFLLMYSKGLYTLIPKRCFSSTEEINAFRDLINGAIG